MALRVAVASAAVLLGVALVVTAIRESPPVPAPVVMGPSVDGPRVAAAGDIACDPTGADFGAGDGEDARCRQQATSDLLVDGRYDAVFVLGDVQYEDGAYSKFLESYEPSWGRVRPSTRPVPGNHDYRDTDASGYFRYFGQAAGDPARGYYSFEVGAWHVVALNSNCAEVGGCGEGSEQEGWLRRDLGANRATCTLAYWHHPRYSSGLHGSDPTYRAFWQTLSAAGADVVLVGHDHDYERFAPQDANGHRDLDRGLRQFVVGTGGHSLRRFPRIAPNSEVRDASSFGVLELTLGSDAYAWRFRPAVGSFTDSGSTSCH